MAAHHRPYLEPGYIAPKIQQAGPRSWKAVAEQLKANPGVWHEVLGGWASMTSTIKKARLVAFRPAGSFEAHATYGVLYVRYVGPRPE